MNGQWPLYGSAIIFTLLSQIIVALQPQVIKITIDSVIGNDPLTNTLIAKVISFSKLPIKGAAGLLSMAGFVFVFALLRGLCSFLRINLASAATERSVKNLRNRLYNHIQLLPYAYHTQAKTGNLIQRCTSDIETIRLALYSQMMDTVSSVFLIIYTVFLMRQSNSKLTLTSFTVMPCIFLFSVIFFKIIGKQFKIGAEREAAMTTTIQENLTGIRVVKAFMRQQYEIEKFNAKSEAYRNQNLKLVRSFALFWSIADFLSATQTFIIILYGSFLAYRSEISVGTLVAFITYVGMLVQPIRNLGRIISNIGKAFVSANRIEEILKEKPEELFPSNERPEIKGNIVFDSVSFAYPGEENSPALKNISFSIKQGQTVAILGPTGSGKSSLVHLLARLYEYSSGSIKIDGIELNTIDKGWIRSKIGLVLQEPFLYGKTIMENIKLAVPETSDSEAERYSKTASLDREIAYFADGYSTIVGERGVSLSGGQKQRLAIARTLIKNSPILIFDDSLSAVDMKTDTQIRAALKEEGKNKTVIIISHRIATIKDADMIIVLEDGKISAQGTHDELARRDGLYKRIYDIQSTQ